MNAATQRELQELNAAFEEVTEAADGVVDNQPLGGTEFGAGS